MASQVKKSRCGAEKDERRERTTTGYAAATHLRDISMSDRHDERRSAVAIVLPLSDEQAACKTNSRVALSRPEKCWMTRSLRADDITDRVASIEGNGLARPQAGGQ